MDLVERSVNYKARLGPSSDSDQDEEADIIGGYMTRNRFLSILLRDSIKIFFEYTNHLCSKLSFVHFSFVPVVSLGDLLLVFGKFFSKELKF